MSKGNGVYRAKSCVCQWFQESKSTDSSPAVLLSACARLRMADSVMDGSRQIHSSNELMNKYILSACVDARGREIDICYNILHVRVWRWIFMRHVCKYTWDIRVRNENKWGEKMGVIGEAVKDDIYCLLLWKSSDHVIACVCLSSPNLLDRF